MFDVMPEAARKQPFDELYAELGALEEGGFAEIVGGALRVLPRPGFRHARAASKLGALLDGPFGFDDEGGEDSGWVFLGEPDVRFGDELRVPDLAGWRAERFRPPERGPFTVAPDWICEVLSPSTAQFDRVEKMPLYAAYQVAHLWLVDPERRTLEVYQREGKLWLALASYADDATFRAPPFDAIAFDLGALWRLPRPPA